MYKKKEPLRHATAPYWFVVNIYTESQVSAQSEMKHGVKRQRMTEGNDN